MLKESTQSFERYSLAEKSEYMEVSVLVDQDLDSVECSKLSEGHFLQLKSLAQSQLRCFLDSRFVYEAVPENSKIIAVSSNLPLLITLSFLLEDKKKSLMVYDELEDCFIGSFTCCDVLLIFYVLHLMVQGQGEKELGGDFPFGSLEELSKCSTRAWMKRVLETNGSLSTGVITMKRTLYEGLKLCLELEYNYKRITLRDQRLDCRDLGTWVVEDRNDLSEFESLREDMRSRSVGLYPICYFSPLTILSDLVQNLQICSGTSGGELQCGDQDDAECDLSPRASILGRIFHNKVIRHLGLGKDVPRCIRASSPFKKALEMFLKEGLTHIPIVTQEDEVFTGVVLTIEKCCTYLARCVSNQDKARMEDPIQSIFNIESGEANDMLGGTVLQLSGPNCGESCFEYRSVDVTSGTGENTECETCRSSFLADVCLSGAISHILLSEDQCLTLVDKKTSQVTALLTALDICKLLVGAKAWEEERG